ncbi:fatty acid synthase [Bemisia tabaci]
MLVMERPSSINPFFTIREILSELSYAYKAKCCLILDEYAPKFSSSNDLYWKQFEKDLAINVLENGRWGCYRKQQIPKTILTRLLPAMPVADRVSDDVDIQFIGLNETDSEGGEGEVAVLDYSGITASGDHVMGIACKESGAGKKVILDPILQWKIPKDVPLDDAAALPFAYLMANYVIRDCFKPKVLSKVVLVYNGHTANGLAQIAVALAEGYTVHTTVPDDEAKGIIRRLFPKLPEWQISNHNEPNYYIPLMRSTATGDRLAGAGADIVISDLPPEKMLVAWTLVAQLGCFYNLSDEVFKHNVPLPMNKFIYSTSFVSCTKANIIDMAPEKKQVLKGIVDEFLRDGQVVRLPFETLSVENISSKPRIIKESLQSGGKLLLKLQSSIKNRNNQRISSKCTSCDPDGTYLVLSSTISKTAGVIKWLLTQGAKSIAIATTNRASGMNAAREIDDCIVKYGATVLMTGGAKAATIEEATVLVEQASKLSRVAAVFTIGLDSNTTIVSNIKQVMKKMKLPGPLVNLHGKNSRIVPDTISIACEGNVNYDQVLSHAMTNPDEAAAYAVTERTRNKDARISVLDQNTRRTQKLTDYLPSSVENLEEMGRLLAYNDATCDTQTLAKFVLTTTKAPFDKLYKEIRPVFVIPAFCETQIRPLISKLMYPCFVAHIKPDVPTVNQVALHLLKSMMRIQKKGPYTIVGETLSGGVAMVLSRLLSDAGHEVSLFLLQGIPDKMQTLLPSQENLSEYLVDVLFNTNSKFTSSRSTRGSGNFLDSLPDTCDKSLVERAFKAIHKSLELSISCATAVKQKGTLILMEMEYFCQLSIDDIDQMSEKSVRLVKSERNTYEEMLTDPVILRTIARDAAFSWTPY